MARAPEGARSPARGGREALPSCVGGWPWGGAADGTPSRQPQGASPHGQLADGTGA